MKLLGAIIRADARRAASWMAFLAAFATAWEWSARQGFPGAVSAWLCGGALAIAAIGAPLPSCAAPLLPASAWAGLRVAWPAVGALLGAAARSGVVGDPDTGTSARLLLFLLGVCAALSPRLAAARAGEAEADGASLSLSLLGTAALAGMAWHEGATIVVAWCLLAGTLAWLGNARAGGAGPVATRVGRGGGPASMMLTPLRRGLVGAAMVMALAGMMRWLFLEPLGAVNDLWASLLGFVALAAPAATIGDDRLDPRLGRLLANGFLPGLRPKARSFAAPDGGGARALAAGVQSLLALHAVVIAWPSVVACVLLLGDRPRALGTIGIAAAVGLAASTLGLLASRRLPLGSPETRLAAGLALSVVIGMAASR